LDGQGCCWCRCSCLHWFWLVSTAAQKLKIHKRNAYWYF
jgi:hypothetical protein